MSAKDLKVILRGQMKDYEKSLRCDKLDGRRATAISNGAALDAMHERNGNVSGSNPSTGVWRLVKDLEEKAGPPGLAQVGTSRS